jgi:hypothetical protein
MRKKITFVASVMVFALAAGVTGCAMHITMNPTSAAELPNKHIPCKVTLVIDSEFQNYHWQGFSGAELRGLYYDLGSASKNLFLEAFRLASDGVTVVESKPTYPVPGHSDVVLVVHPRITGFSEKHSLWIRNTDYYAEITYHVTVYGKTGKILLEKNYYAKGVAMGSTDVYRNYAAPAEKAMAQAIVTIIDDMRKMVSLQNSDYKVR